MCSRLAGVEKPNVIAERSIDARVYVHAFSSGNERSIDRALYVRVSARLDGENFAQTVHTCAHRRARARLMKRNDLQADVITPVNIWSLLIEAPDRHTSPPRVLDNTAEDSSASSFPV